MYSILRFIQQPLKIIFIDDIFYILIVVITFGVLISIKLDMWIAVWGFCMCFDPVQLSNRCHCKTVIPYLFSSFIYHIDVNLMPI